MEDLRRESARETIVNALQMVTEPSKEMIEREMWRSKTTREYYAKCLDNISDRAQPQRSHTRTDDTFAAWVAAPIWAYVWCLTFGRFGKPLWRVA